MKHLIDYCQRYDPIDQLRDYERPDNHGKSYLKSFISRSMSLTAKMNSK